ncbi:MAG: hypothetical protein AB8G05_01355 [Oligoflexales bacterium]
MQNTDSTSQLRNGKAVSSMEFAEILGVNKSTVSRAIKSKRLEHSLVKADGQIKILVYEACVEWHLRKNFEKDRYAEDSKDVAESKARHEYYRSLLTKLEYDLKSGHVVPVEEVRQKGMEICLNARRYLDDRRDSDALVLPTFKDAFESRKILRGRDDGFMERLVKLETVGDEVAQETAEKIAAEVEQQGIGDIENAD